MPITDIYLPLSVGFPRDPKVRALVVKNGGDGIMAAYLYLMMALYCRENLTDGWVPEEEIGALAYPIDMRTAKRLAMLAASERLLSAHSDPHAPGFTVLAYVKRNGTRRDATRRADQAQHAARARWALPNRSGPHADRNADRIPDRNAKSETESIESSARVVDPRARPRAREDDDSNGIENPDDDLDGRIVIMLAAHGYTVNREQARGVRLRIIGGRKVDNAARYVSAALATRDGARKWAPSPAAMPPRGLDPVTAARAAQLRAAEAGQDTLDGAERADTAHRGGDAARKLLADRPRAEVTAATPARELHGSALAAAQVAESRASRAMPLRTGDDDEDRTDEQDDDPWSDDDDDQDDDDDEFGTYEDPDDDGPEFLGDRKVDDVDLPADDPPF